MQVLWGIGGIVALLATAFLLSTNRRAINLRTVIGALIIQIAFAFIVLYWDLGRQALQILTSGVGGMAPSRRSQIAQFGIRALIAGTLANLLNAAIAGMLVG